MALSGAPTQNKTKSHKKQTNFVGNRYIIHSRFRPTCRCVPVSVGHTLYVLHDLFEWILAMLLNP